MRGEHGEERRSCIEDRGEAAGKVRLAPGDEGEGQALLPKPSTASAAAALTLRGDATPISGAPAQSSAAARPTRRATSVSGGNSLTATPTKKNDPPHNRESITSSPHSRAVIARCIAAVIVASPNIFVQ